jgi:hypothetical protein
MVPCRSVEMLSTSVCPFLLSYSSASFSTHGLHVRTYTVVVRSWAVATFIIIIIIIIKTLSHKKTGGGDIAFGVDNGGSIAEEEERWLVA